MNGSVNIRKGILSDISQILELQKKSLLKNKSLKVAEKEGFIVYPISEDELKGIISSNCCFLIVAVYGDKVVGYASAYDLNIWRKIKTKWKKRALITSTIQNHFSLNKILYFRHIVRDDGFGGVGYQLEEYIYSLAREKDYKFVIAEILESPLKNKKSIEVHEKRGFVKIGYVDYFDGNFWGLYEKNLA